MQGKLVTRTGASEGRVGCAGQGRSPTCTCAGGGCKSADEDDKGEVDGVWRSCVVSEPGLKNVVRRCEGCADIEQETKRAGEL